MKEDARQLYKLKFDCGRQGVLEGLFFAKPEEVELAIGREVHFGEAMGRHSEIYGTLSDKEVELVDIGEDIAVVRRHADVISSGYNPLDYVQCEECGASGRSAVNPSGICDYFRDEG